ncbi:MAG: hypothetical protein VXW31_07570, partial [Planctomycetota bacterium]|nr:hypothetical protein [Planctomycetota bacterium]
SKSSAPRAAGAEATIAESARAAMVPRRGVCRLDDYAATRPAASHPAIAPGPPPTDPPGSSTHVRAAHAAASP